MNIYLHWSDYSKENKNMIVQAKMFKGWALIWFVWAFVEVCIIEKTKFCTYDLLVHCGSLIIIK